MNIKNNLFWDLIHQYQNIYIAYSGGVDSHVLLHIIYNLCITQGCVHKLIAIHINHALNPNANMWEQHCKKICNNLGVHYLSKSIAGNEKNPHQSLEEYLRKLRYAELSSNLKEQDCLVTAHHADDQIETVLLQLFRGSGPKGLSAMSVKMKYVVGWLLRPLLPYTRTDIIQYANFHNLNWIEDDSNNSIQHDRNYLRHCVLPKIKERWPGIITTINRTARNCAEASQLLELLADYDLQNCINQDKQNILCIQNLKKISILRQKNLIRWWLYKLYSIFPSEVILNEILRTIIYSKYEAKPKIKWAGIKITREKYNLISKT